MYSIVKVLPFAVIWIADQKHSGQRSVFAMEEDLTIETLL